MRLWDICIESLCLVNRFWIPRANSPLSLPLPRKKGKPSKDLCTIDCNHETFCWRFQTYRITGESWASERDRKGWNLLWFNIRKAPPISFQPTPAVEQGRLPWCLKCECVELADPSPGSSKSTVPQRVSLGWVVQVSPQPELLPLDLLKTENRNNRLGNTETLVYTTLVGSHAHSLKWLSILFHNIWIKNLCHTSKKNCSPKNWNTFQ